MSYVINISIVGCNWVVMLSFSVAHIGISVGCYNLNVDKMCEPRVNDPILQSPLLSQGSGSPLLHHTGDASPPSIRSPFEVHSTCNDEEDVLVWISGSKAVDIGTVPYVL